MNQAQLASLKKGSRRVITTLDLLDRTPRTLLYGYTGERNTWHVYLGQDGFIHRVVYRNSHAGPRLLLHSAGISGGCTANEQLVPDKRLYPESCDAQFCSLLVAAGQTLPFTSHDETLHARRLEAHAPYAGATFENLVRARKDEALA